VSVQLDDGKVMGIWIQKSIAKVHGMIDDLFHNKTLIYFGVIGAIVTPDLDFLKAFRAMSCRQQNVGGDHLYRG
jgi:hypothetical protein